MQTLDNKVTIVTGGNNGIGKAISNLFLKEKAKVVVFDKDITRQTKRESQQPEYCKCDICNEAQVQDNIDYVSDSYGHIDVLVNNAGVNFMEGELTGLEQKVINEILDVNIKGTLLMSKHVLRRMKQQKSGVIINIGSILGVIGAENTTAYSGSKAAVIGMTRAMAIENSPYGIRVNSVSPSIVETDMMKEQLNKNPEFREKLLNAHPYKRFLKPQEIAQTVLYLASDKSSFINGQNIVLDNGRSIYDR